MRLTKAERKAVLMVGAAAAAVAVSGVKLLNRHTAYIVKKAAAFFHDEDGKQEEK